MQDLKMFYIASEYYYPIFLKGTKEETFEEFQRMEEMLLLKFMAQGGSNFNGGIYEYLYG